MNTIKANIESDIEYGKRVLKQNNAEGNCPKCKDVELEYDSGATMENEKYYCEGCNTLYEVQVELVRFWETLEEVDK